MRSDAERDRQQRAEIQARAQAAASITGKACLTCRKTKGLDQFSAHRSARDGLRRSCRACCKAGRALKPKTAKQLAKTKARNKTEPYRVANRLAVDDWSRRNPEAVRARSILRRALRSGQVKKAPHCQAEGCRRKRVQAHHHNYARPLDVVWLCPRHHRRGHACGVIRLADGVPAKLGRVPQLV